MSFRSRPKSLYQSVTPTRWRRTVPLTAVTALVAGLLVAVPGSAEEYLTGETTVKLSVSTVRVDSEEHDEYDSDLLEISADLEVDVTTLVAPTDSESPKAGWTDAEFLTSYDPTSYIGSMVWITRLTGADAFWAAGYRGAGVDVALIDTGVVPVPGLTGPDKVVNGADLSFESQAENLRHLDTFGHGTHLAGIIAGDLQNDEALLDAGGATGADPGFTGMAPGSRLVSLKVGDSMGAVDVSQVIAAIDWVVEHRRDNGMNIRVITLAYGTDGLQPYEIDPLTNAVERAWHAGIVVVVAAGNDGNAEPLRNPAYDPYIIAVGAAENGGFQEMTDVASFSNCGNEARWVDLVAPGRSIVSLRNPGSYIDSEYPEAVVADHFFLGSGTSQAAAVVAGGVALLLDQRPDLRPDQVKALLEESAFHLSGAKSMCQGAGTLDLAAALTTATPRARQSHPFAMGSGLLEAARGSNHVYDEDVALTGEMDILSSRWHGYDCEVDDGRLECDSLWDGGEFNGAIWTGGSWSGGSWSGASWSGASWSGASWSSKSWSGASWSGASWSGASWSGASWSGASWSGDTWSGLSWG
jgi:serine protease AprX